MSASMIFDPGIPAYFDAVAYISRAFSMLTSLLQITQAPEQARKLQHYNAIWNFENLGISGSEFKEVSDAFMSDVNEA
eukprot:191122-Karenia_brevis.AAC.1